MLKSKGVLWLSGVSLTLLLTGCNQAHFSGCPPLVTYSKTFQNQAAAELREIANDSAVAALIVDYGKMRDACRVPGGLK